MKLTYKGEEEIIMPVNGVDTPVKPGGSVEISDALAKGLLKRKVAGNPQWVEAAKTDGPKAKTKGRK